MLVSYVLLITLIHPKIDSKPIQLGAYETLSECTKTARNMREVHELFFKNVRAEHKCVKRITI